jgi:hypothetical protein
VAPAAPLTILLSCSGAFVVLGAPLAQAAEPRTSRAAVPGDASGLVAPNCAATGLSPCWSSIQQGIDGIEALHPDAPIRTLYIAPGEYRETAVCMPAAGNTNLIGMGLGNTLIARGTASITPPKDDGPAATLTLGGCNVQNLRVLVGEDDGDRGIYLTGLPVPEQVVSDVTVNGKLGAGAVGIDVAFTAGFVAFMNTRVILNCLASADADTAALRVEVPDGKFAELRFEYGLFELKNAPCPLDASVFDFRRSSTGGGALGTEIFFAQVQCVETTCFEIAADGVNLNLGSIDLRRNQARFFRVHGDGSSSRIFLKGIESAFDFREPSIWNNVTPHGALNLTVPSDSTVAPPEQCFPGWTLTLESGPPGRTFAVCEGSAPPAWVFK